MSGDGKRSVGLRPQATAPILDSTIAYLRHTSASKPLQKMGGRQTLYCETPKTIKECGVPVGPAARDIGDHQHDATSPPNRQVSSKFATSGFERLQNFAVC